MQPVRAPSHALSWSVATDAGGGLQVEKDGGLESISDGNGRETEIVVEP